MIKNMLTLLEITPQLSNQYYYSFRCNLKEYFVFRDNSYKLFCYTDFKFLEAEELITEFWIENYSVLMKEKQSETKIFDRLKDTTFNKALGQYLKLRKLENTKHIEKNIPQKDIDEFLSMEGLSQRFFLTKEGLSIFTYPKIKKEETLPNGMIYFNRFNCLSVGNPILRIDRIGKRNIQLEKEEETNVLFSPYSIIDLYKTGRSYFKDNIIVISDVNKYKIIEEKNIKIHLRPTKQELYNYLLFLKKMSDERNIKFIVDLDENNILYITLYSSNYAKTRNSYISKMQGFKNIISQKESQDDFNLKLIKKNVPGKDGSKMDLIQFSFLGSADNLITFIKIFIHSFFDKSLGLKRITEIHYENEFPLIIEEAIPIEFIEFEDKYTKPQKEGEYVFDDDFDDY